MQKSNNCRLTHAASSLFNARVQLQVENQYLDFRKSSIHNVGAYAKRDIRKGTRIIEYIGRPLTKKKASAELADGNGYVFTINKHFDIDGNVPWNPARFINHGCAANAESDIEDDRVWIDALRTIRKGEEVLYNYNYDLVDAFENPCNCGAKECVGYMVDDEYWPKLKKMIEKREKKKGK
ncbi:MAG: SET domain-containing protein-lysine N-methyltransferase [Verrucomicrobia subdivision 3 bacterium]|nr:SET domain-containing protein-lysine N-methyltransferase [Limisphaerales bacterium]